VDPEFPEHATGQVFDIDRSNLPRGERECLNFALDDMGWSGYLGFIQVNGDTLHIGSSPSSREFFDLVFQEASDAQLHAGATEQRPRATAIESLR
jgi:hypothetical protein